MLNEFKAMPMGLGMWVTPNGKGEEISQTHISDIMHDPKKFGVTQERVMATFMKYGEQYGSEGKARDELIIIALKSGWVRIRNYRNYTSVVIWKLTDRVRRNLEQWVEDMQKRYSVSPYEELRITELVNSRTKKLSVSDISEKGYLQESFKNPERTPEKGTD